jgi:hypothetical protein
MNNLNYQDLRTELGAGVVEFVGNNQVKLNLNQLTGQDLTLESSIVEGMVQLGKKLADFNTKINQERQAASPSLPSINFATAQLSGTADNPEYVITIRAKVDTSQFLTNLVDPTATD